jgi:beta-glucanase (GH16 family)
MFCHSPYPVLHHLVHRYYPPVYCDESNEDPFGEMTYLVYATEQYETYKCIWTPSKIEYYVNDDLRHTINNTGQEWYPSLNLGVILSQQVCTPFNEIGQQINPVAPQTSYFDYVRVKQFFLAPEITCPQIICSTNTATMDVDPAATNISWALTPASLFTGSTSGTGTTANITASSANQGKGKITYTFAVGNYGETFTAEKEMWINGPDYSEISFDVYRSDGTHAT